MADRPISELTPVTTVTTQDNFVLEQNSRAMRLTGQVLLTWLAREMDAHGGIRSVVKTSTDVLVDTYTITYADDTTTTFTVNNGRSISSIEKTGTQVLVDTYTISFNDSSTSTFTVTNGNGISNITKTSSGLTDTYTLSFTNGGNYSFDVDNGNGIVRIEKTDTQVLVDTYTITYSDGTDFSFDVTNGNGISNIQKTSSTLLEDTYTITYTGGSTSTFVVNNGRSVVSITKTGTVDLVDTYTISYNDNTTSTFTVTNGAKGDNAYTWVKYSVDRPTRDADMLDSPNNWIGIYTGYSSTAPTHYSDYVWFKIKGEKGDTGDDLTVQSTEIRYGTSDSESTQPSTWQETMPTVQQGKYLWTRVIFHFSDLTSSDPIYLKTRMGMDGTGTVSSVNGISPDANGDVSLISVQGTMLVIKEGA